MKKKITHTINIVLALVFAVIFAGTALAAGATEKTSQPQNGNYETVEGVLSIKEGHGDFLIRMSNGKAQRFSLPLGAGGVEITRNGKSVRYSELKPKDKIQVKYDGTNRKVIAIHASGS